MLKTLNEDYWNWVIEWRFLLIKNKIQVREGSFPFPKFLNTDGFLAKNYFGDSDTFLEETFNQFN